MFKVFLCIGLHHDWRLVGLAACVCVAAAFATLFLYSKAPSFPLWKRSSWLAMTGLVAGSGIWTTHFVGMLAFKTGLPTGYAPIATMGSLAVAIASTTAGFALAGMGRGAGTRRRWLTAAGGLVVGIGITCMHYVGMMGYRTAGVLSWDPAYVAASVMLGAVLATAALLVARPDSQRKGLFAAALLLTLAIVGMHFTGMTAVTITPDARIQVPRDLISDATLVVIAVAVTAVILLTAVGAVVFDTASRNGNLRRLREALDVMPDGLAFYDASDRLVAWNSQYEDRCAEAGATLFVGLPFSDLLALSIAHGAYREIAGREVEWLAERKAARRGEIPYLTLQTAAGRWLRITERRTADGGAVSVSVDITELKRAELEMAAERDKAEELARRAEAAETVAGLGHWRLDARTHEVVWSPQMYRIYGIDPDKPLDLGVLMTMTHPDDRAASDLRLERALLHGEPDDNSITRIKSRTGETRYLAGNSNVERGPDGEILAVIGGVVDVTEQKAAELAIAKSEERFRRLAVNAPDMIAESTLDGILTYVSPVSTAITGFTPEELVGRPFVSVMHPEDGQKVLAMCQAVFASKGKIAPWPVEFRATHKDGRPIWLECKPSLALDADTGRFVGLTDVIRDITDRKALEAELRLARAEAEDAAAVKAEFLANMSHELRTPLTSIIGFTGLAAEQADLTPLTRTYVERVSEASRALLCTVNDILDFSKLEAGQVAIHPQPVSMSKLSRATLDLFTPQAGAKDIDLVLDEDAGGADLVLSVDPDRVRQILLNFVSNAVKFTAAGAVTLRTRYDQDAARLRVEVIDTGDGIPPDKQARLFKRFSQIDGSLTRSHSGTGLGLAICKGLVEAMGGEVGLDSTVGEGSCFWFEIPAPVAHLAAANDEGPASERLGFDGVRVLVADDHPTNRELARLFLVGVGAEVFEAEDGEAAVAAAADWPFDVILMDLRMPRLDGFGALEQIRAGGGPNDATPILAFNADVTGDMTQRLLAGGFAGVVAKPLEPAALIAALARATDYVHEPQMEDQADVG
jgi:PAS domain S-box-containing protein